jgi:hypothetical protein
MSEVHILIKSYKKKSFYGPICGLQTTYMDRYMVIDQAAKRSPKGKEKRHSNRTAKEGENTAQPSYKIKPNQGGEGIRKKAGPTEERKRGGGFYV